MLLEGPDRRSGDRVGGALARCADIHDRPIGGDDPAEQQIDRVACLERKRGQDPRPEREALRSLGGDGAHEVG